MDKQELDVILSQAMKEKGLLSSDIPPLDLYIDQILTLFSDNVEPELGRALTKTMINNYSKDGLIKPVKGKKYSKEHIVQMMIIYYLKDILSIGDIKQILDGIYSDETFDGDKLISCYDRFLDIKLSQDAIGKKVTDHLTSDIGLDPQRDEDFFVMLMSIVSICNSLRRSALEMIKAKYPPTTDKAETAEKPKEKKQKKERKKGSLAKE